MQESDKNATEYEAKYREGYGLVYPDGHVIRVHRQILEWELGIRGGRIFDFGCGSGAHLKYFADQGFTPHGCDTSSTAIQQCRARMPQFGEHFFVNEIIPDLPARFGGAHFDVFLSNQVLYYLNDDGIRSVSNQAHAILKPGGVFVVSMMPRACWYAQHATERQGEFHRVVLNTARQHTDTFINFKEPEEWSTIFGEFEKLHLGSYSWHIREDEGAHVHWLFIGRKR